MSIYTREKTNNSLTTSKSQKNLILRKRIQSANFTQIIKNRLFKGYNRIKFVNSKDFNLDLFLSDNPEEKYLPDNEKYNIYYENKYLNKYRKDSKYSSLVLKNSLINPNYRKRKIFKNKSASFSSIFNIDKTHFSPGQKIRKSFLYDINNSKSNINESKKIFENEEEKNIFSKYPYLLFDKMPDNINHPKNLRNYPHYNPKYKQKNKNQQYFLFTLSHQKDKKVHNFFRPMTPKMNFKKNKINYESINNSSINNDKYNLVSFSCSTTKKNNVNLRKLINSIKTAKLKRFLLKTNTKTIYKEN